MIPSPAGFADFVESEQVHAVHLIFGGGLALTSHQTNLIIGGVEYQAIGEIINVANITRTKALNIGPFNITLSGASRAVADLITATDPIGDPLIYSVVLLNDDGSIGSVVPLYRGIIDSWALTERAEGKSLIKLAVNNDLARTSGTNARYFAPASQRAHHADDRFFDYASPHRPENENWGGQKGGAGGGSNYKEIGAAIPIPYGVSRIKPFLVDRFVRDNLRASTLMGNNNPRRTLGTIRTGAAGNSSYLFVLFALTLGQISRILYFIADGERHTINRFLNSLRFGYRRGTRVQNALPEYYQNHPFGADANYRGAGIVSALMIAFYDPVLPVFDQQPKVEGVVEGLLLYDPRDASHAPPDNDATSRASKGWAYSANPALVLLDYLTAIYGPNIALANINLATFTAAANLCDEPQPIPDTIIASETFLTYDPASGVLTEINTGERVNAYRSWQTGLAIPRYECNGALPSDLKYTDAIKRILATMSGHLFFSNGRFSLYLDEPAGDPVLVATPRHIGKTGFTYKRTSRSGRINQATIKFKNRSLEFQDDNAVWPVDGDVRLAAYIAADGELRNKTMTIEDCVDYYQALDLAEHLVRLSRLDKIVSFTLTTLHGLLMEPGDLIELQHPSLYAEADPPLYRVESVAINTSGNLTAKITARVYDRLAYSWSVKDNELLKSAGEIATLFERGTITGLAVEWDYHENQDGTLIPLIRVAWAAVENKDVGYVIFLVDLGLPAAADSFFAGAVVDEIDILSTNTEFRGIRPERTYRIYVFYRPALGGLAGQATADVFLPGLTSTGAPPVPETPTTLLNVPGLFSATAIQVSLNEHFSGLSDDGAQMISGWFDSSLDPVDGVHDALVVEGVVQTIATANTSQTFRDFLTARSDSNFVLSLTLTAQAISNSQGVDNPSIPSPTTGAVGVLAFFLGQTNLIDVFIEVQSTANTAWHQIIEREIRLQNDPQSFFFTLPASEIITNIRIRSRRKSGTAQRHLISVSTPSAKLTFPPLFSGFGEPYPARANITNLQINYGPTT